VFQLTEVPDKETEGGNGTVYVTDPIFGTTLNDGYNEEVIKDDKVPPRMFSVRYQQFPLIFDNERLRVTWLRNCVVELYAG